ncbi:MAG: hypothetical protein A2041_10375 [Bacteroidetes bacterium GWA2_31_9b]|nr:MAG: hypothetical protein A2041_10375 [Bacteroidetes bacterium GWA2_31_9b]
MNENNQTQNPNNYKWGILYFNKKDTRLFAPKLESQRGWTINFANPLSYIFIILLIIILIFSSILL